MSFTVVPPVVRFEQTDARIAYGGPWAQSADTSRSAGSWAYVNASATAVSGVRRHLLASFSAPPRPSTASRGCASTVGRRSTRTSTRVTYKHRVPVFAALGLASDCSHSDYRVDGPQERGVQQYGRRHRRGGCRGHSHAGDPAVRPAEPLRAGRRPHRLRGFVEYRLERKSLGRLPASASNTSGSSAYVTFTGTSVALIGSTAPTYGIARATIDGGAPVDVDFYSAGYLHQARSVQGVRPCRGHARAAPRVDWHAATRRRAARESAWTRST